MRLQARVLAVQAVVGLQELAVEMRELPIQVEVEVVMEELLKVLGVQVAPASSLSDILLLQLLFPVPRPSIL